MLILFYGGEDDDIILMSTDGDTTGDKIDGGEGFDTVNYQGLTSGVTVDLSGNTIAQVTVGTNTNDHTLTAVENIIGTIVRYYYRRFQIK